MIAQEDAHMLLWQPVVIEPVAGLGSLRDTVLTINPKRCPKWRFRLGEDMVMQLQPCRETSPSHRVLFKGMAIEGSGITREHFESERSRGRDLTVLGFDIKDGAWFMPPAPDRWVVRVSRAPLPAERGLALKVRLIDVLPQLNQLTQALMFSPACLICGKRLTDPVSMARCIGPECSHNYTLDVGLFAVMHD
jgi:hypothetical protein